jgi:hypothetical protein
MQPLSLALMPPTLRLGDLLRNLAMELGCLELLAVAGRHRGFQAQIQSDALLGCVDGDYLIGYWQAQIPIADRVFHGAPSKRD